MKYIELKDLNAGDNLILAWQDDENKWYPYNVIVQKGGQKIKLVDPDEEDLSIPFIEFHRMTKGYDINGKRIIELGVWDNVESCQKWCDFENKINNM